MIFIRFTCANGETRHFVGKDEESILADTKGGKDFGGLIYTGHSIVTEQEVRALDFEFLDKGIASVKEGLSKSYYLG